MQAVMTEFGRATEGVNLIENDFFKDDVFYDPKTRRPFEDRDTKKY